METPSLDRCKLLFCQAEITSRKTEQFLQHTVLKKLPAATLREEEKQQFSFHMPCITEQDEEMMKMYFFQRQNQIPVPRAVSSEQSQKLPERKTYENSCC